MTFPERAFATVASTPRTRPCIADSRSRRCRCRSSRPVSNRGSRSSTTRCSESSSRWMASLRRISAAASVKTPRRWVASSKLSDQVLGRRLSAKPSPSSKLTGSTVGWPGTRASAMTFYYNVQATQASAAFLILPSDSAMPTFSSSSKESLPPKTLSTRNADTVDVLPPGASRRSVTVTPFSAGVIS